MEWYKFIVSEKSILNGKYKEITDAFQKIIDEDFNGNDEDLAVFYRISNKYDNTIYYVSPKLCESDLTKEFLKEHDAEPCEIPVKGRTMEGDRLKLTIGNQKMWSKLIDLKVE